VPHTDIIARVSKVSTDVEYLQRIEALARKVIDQALDEGWLTLDPEDEVHQTPLQRAVNERARHLRHKHYEGDGCLNQD